MNEKERVYQELDESRRKLAKLRIEIRRLNRVVRERTPSELNAERARLRTALSFIAFAPDAPQDVEFFKRVAAEALNPPPIMLQRGKGRAAREFRANRRHERELAHERAGRHLEGQPQAKQPGC